MLRPSCKRFLGLVEAQSKLTSKSVPCRLYHDYESLDDHCKNPRNLPETFAGFDKNDPDVGTGHAGYFFGHKIKLQIKVEHKTQKIVDVCHIPLGSPSVVACSSLASEWIKGKEIEEALQFKNSEIAKHYKSLPRGKLNWNILAEHAIEAAIKNYEVKRGKHLGGSSTSPTNMAHKDKKFAFAYLYFLLNEN